jgi:hypothetical protein
MMKEKRFVSALLAAALTAALVLPAQAAGSSFADVSDQSTAVNADILRLMGVVGGVGSNQFQPDARLTRAEFCTMVVKFLQRGDEVARNSTRTIFTDVTAKHWGLGYVNLAASIRVGEGDGAVPLISGVGDGRFSPDAEITLAQATTILIRVLGYSSAQTGSVWPQSYLELARSIGLTDQVSAGAYDSITRAQAAQLFVNALSCKTGSGTVYFKGLGTDKEKIIILAVNVSTDDGRSDGAIRTTDDLGSGAYLAAAGAVKPTALVGKRGDLILNSKGEIVTFVPDDSEATTITLSGSAQPSYLKGTNGQQYTMNQSTMLYTASSKEGQRYVDGYTALLPGTQVTLYAEKGKITAVYASGSTATSADKALVVTGTVQEASLYSLTGGASGFTIQKNRQTISLSQLKPYDVVTYDQLSNTLIASDLKLTCIYEDATPTAKAPTSITVLGYQFPVLDSAWDSIQSFGIGDSVTLLLTADGQVAGMISPSGQLGTSAVGMVSDSGATLFLPSGGTIQLTGKVSNSDQLTNQLVTLSSSVRGSIAASRLSASGISGSFQVAGGTLGGRTVAAGVRIFEQVSGGAMVEISLADLDMDVLAADQIAACHVNSSNMVDYLVLRPTTGNAYQYGILTEGEPQEGGSGELSYSNRTVVLTNSSGASGALVTGASFQNGGFGGLAVGQNGTAAGVVALTAIQKVKPTDFFDYQGAVYVNAGGKTYRVADQVECYKTASKSWFTESSGTARLNACKAFSSDLTVYVDPVGEKVRVVVAN